MVDNFDQRHRTIDQSLQDVDLTLHLKGFGDKSYEDAPTEEPPPYYDLHRNGFDADHNEEDEDFAPFQVFDIVRLAESCLEWRKKGASEQVSSKIHHDSYDYDHNDHYDHNDYDNHYDQTSK
ncbi:unnamed protein product [Cladocopium goreaui]|uniref:Uncharacterized protein n=1 Tax=Cladocopium goreaui TaxID=2562237 RepID=A0A9P1G537_9DINO|nr:unnamed protein product [Cladocopium goreaui]